MQVSATANIKFGTTVRELKDMLAQIPDEAKVNVRSYSADRPGESSSSTVTFTWDMGKN